MKKLFILIVPLLSIACSICKVPKLSPIREVQFGNGGGVTQSITRYTLKPNGKLYKGQEIIAKIPKDDVVRIYTKAASLKEKDVNSPSNTFSFINIVKTDTMLYYCWNIVAPFPIMELDSELNNVLPK